MLHVAQVSFFTDPQGRPPQQLLGAWPSLVDVAESASSAGVRVSVIQASSHSLELAQNGVSYHFLPFGRGSPSSPASAAAADGGFPALVRKLRPDVFHVHGLGFWRDFAAIAHSTPDPVIVVQDHADRPPPPWRRFGWRRSSRIVAT